MNAVASERPHHGRCALVIGHPGHELRLFGWLHDTRPDVFVLTDGSGHGACSRIESTRRVLERQGACPGSLFGRYTDQQIYGALLRSDTAFFIELVERLTELLLPGRYHTLVTDPMDGYNPTHDLCCVMAHAAARRVFDIDGRAVRMYAYPLTRLVDCESRSDVETIRLTPDMVRRKRAAVDEYTELSAETHAAVRREGDRAYHDEFLLESGCRTPGVNGPAMAAFDRRPYYETYGERQAAAGRYTDVIRYRDHFVPVTNAIWDWAYARPRSLHRQDATRRISP